MCLQSQNPTKEIKTTHKKIIIIIIKPHCTQKTCIPSSSIVHFVVISEFLQIRSSLLLLGSISRVGAEEAKEELVGALYITLISRRGVWGLTEYKKKERKNWQKCSTQTELNL
jgi:hypothetical protein